MTQIPSSVRIDGRALLTSGFVLMRVDEAMIIEAANLQLEFVFVDDDGNDPGLDKEEISNTALRIRLRNFKNPLGTSFGPVPIGTLMGKPLSIGIYVSAIGDRLRATHYCMQLGA